MGERAKILGILNVTPDSFSDGGRHLDVDAAIAHAETMVAEGVDIVDIGGESTRPGAERVDPEVERARVLPVVAALARRGVAVSVDTMNASTAREAISAGAAIINDVSGGLADPEMATIVAGAEVRYIAMHWRGHSDVMAKQANYGDVADDVRRELGARVTELMGRGIREEQLILDPGLGFAKDAHHNWQVLSHLDRIRSLGFPVLIGASRKRFLARLPRRRSAEPLGDARDLPTAVVSALAAQAGAWGVRVHDVASTATALDVVEAWQGGGRG